MQRRIITLGWLTLSLAVGVASFQACGEPTPIRLHKERRLIEAQRVQAQRYLMGAPWSMTVMATDEGDAYQAMNAAFDEVARLETMLSEWQDTSEISRVNQNAGIAPVHVSPELQGCVEASLAVSEWSHGAYDISWAAMRDLWDFSETSNHIPPSQETVAARLPLWNHRNIVVDPVHHTLFLRLPGMQIGLGGIAKGFALDAAGAVLIARGFPNFLIFGGGQVLTHGRPGDRKWRVGIQHPREPRYFAFVEIENGSVATSGDYEHAYQYQGQTFHHILDPRTGFPARGLTSVTVVAPTALSADAVDTALFVMGRDQAFNQGVDSSLPIATAPGGPIEAVIVDSEMRASITAGLRESLVLRAEIAADGTIGAALPE